MKLFSRGQVLQRHFQFQDWYLELIVAGFRDGLPIFTVAETRKVDQRGQKVDSTVFLAHDVPYPQAERIFAARANAMSREAGHECTLPTAAEIRRWEEDFHRRQRR